MITIENTCNKAIVFADEIDPATQGLIYAFCGSPVSLGSRLWIMLDAHAGKVRVRGGGGTALQPAVRLPENAKDFPKTRPSSSSPKAPSKKA